MMGHIACFRAYRYLHVLLPFFFAKRNNFLRHSVCFLADKIFQNVVYHKGKNFYKNRLQLQKAAKKEMV